MNRFAISAAALLAVSCAGTQSVETTQSAASRAPDKPTQSINSEASGDRKNNTQPTDRR